jgi:hypothetical protein
MDFRHELHSINFRVFLGRSLSPHLQFTIVSELLLMDSPTAVFILAVFELRFDDVAIAGDLCAGVGFLWSEVESSWPNNVGIS